MFWTTMNAISQPTNSVREKTHLPRGKKKMGPEKTSYNIVSLISYSESFALRFRSFNPDLDRCLEEHDISEIHARCNMTASIVHRR